MLILYNILQIILLILLFPFLLMYILCKRKYRRHMPRRLGLDLLPPQASGERHGKTIWLHALSVGEAASALQLLAGLRQRYPDDFLIVSISTSGGYTFARKRLAPYCDRIIAAPVDFLPVVNHYINILQPSLFVLIETDFWPNLLLRLHQRSIPTLLVNGRLSEKSFAQYSRFSFFFSPLFQSFSACCVQRKQDSIYLKKLGVHGNNIHVLGNLKFEHVHPVATRKTMEVFDKRHTPVCVAGSTHPGEEKILFEIFVSLRSANPFGLVIAPRDISRRDEILTLAKKMAVATQLFSDGEPFTKDCLLVDTIGDLSAIYTHGDFAFIGGSLIDEGGHNPLEPAASGKPVVFGRHMTDFTDIVEYLCSSGGTFIVNDAQELESLMIRFLTDPDWTKKCGSAAFQAAHSIRGVVDSHIALIEGTICR